MTRFLPLALVAATLSLATGCFEIERHVTLQKDGSAKIHDRFAITDSLLAIFREMHTIDPSEDITADAPRIPGREARKTLADHGIKVTKFDSSFTLDKFYYDLQLELSSFADVAHTAAIMPVAEGDTANPMPLSLTRASGRNAYTLTLQADPPPTKEPAAPGASEPAKDAPEDDGGKELTAAEQQKMMELSLSMLDTAKDLEFKQSITVPGTITDWGPKSGALDGNTVTWVQDEATIQEAMASGTDDNGRRWVTFTARGIPDTALYSPGTSTEKAPAKPARKGR